MLTKIKIFILCLISTTINAGPGAIAACSAECALLAWLPPPAFAICYAACLVVQTPILCFSQNTSVITETGLKSITQVELGQKVLTMNKNNQSQWTSVFLKEISAAKEFIKIETSFGILEVTPDHIMIVDEQLIKANDLKIGMFIGEAAIQKLSVIERHKKVTIATKEGTVLANGLLTTTMCGDYANMDLDAQTALSKWQKDHELLMVQ